MGIRLILFLLACWVIYYFIRRLLGNQRTNRSNDPSPPAVDMVRCDLCGTHLPAPEAVSRNGKHYCSREHLKAARDKTDTGE